MTVVLKVLIDWNNDGSFDGQYDDITADIKMVDWSLGMKNPYQPIADESTCNITVENADGKYLPENTLSPLYPNLLPNRRLRIVHSDGVTDTPLWSGWIEFIKPTWQIGPHIMPATITGTGSKRSMSTQEVILPIYNDVTGDVIINDILAQSQIPPAASGVWVLDSPIYSVLPVFLGGPEDYSDVETGLTVIPQYGDLTVTAMKGIQEVTAGEQGRFFFARDGRAIWWNRHHLLTITKAIEPPSAQDSGKNELDGTHNSVVLYDGFGRYDGYASYTGVYSVGLDSFFNGSLGTLIQQIRVNDPNEWAGGIGYPRSVHLESDHVTANKVSFWLHDTLPDNIVASYHANDNVKFFVFPTGGTLDFFTLALTWSTSADQAKAYYNGANVQIHTNLGVWFGDLSPTRCVIGGPNIWNGDLSDTILSNQVADATSVAEINARLVAGTLTGLNLDEIFGFGNWVWWRLGTVIVSSSSGRYKPRDMSYVYGDDVKNIIRIRSNPRTTGGSSVVMWEMETETIIPPAQTKIFEARLRNEKGQFAASGALTPAPVFSSGFAIVSVTRSSSKATVNIANSSPTAPAVMSSLTLSGVPSNNSNQIDVVATDDGSVALYGQKELNINLGTLGDYNGAEDVALFELGRRGQPSGNVRSISYDRKFDGVDNSNLLEWEIGTRLRLVIDEFNHDNSYFIISEKHSYDVYERTKSHKCTFILEPTNRNSFWILDDEIFGLLDQNVLAY